MGMRAKMGKRLSLVILAVALAGCGSENAEKSTLSLATAAVAGSVKARRAEPPKPLNITQPMLDRTKEGVLLVLPEALGAPSLLRRVARRQDATPGTVEVWSASDGAQVVLRGGVLISTRGVGGDIASSDVSQTMARLSALQPGPARRIVTLRAGDHSIVPLDMNCQITDLGSEGVVLVDRPVALRHFQETCPANGGTLVYDYWVDPSSRLIRKSRQWTGPDSQYYQITLLKN